MNERPSGATRKMGHLQHLGWEPNVPLVKSTSKEAFRKNVKAEIASGKPQKQAVAIAYSVKREAAKKAPVKSKK